LYGGEQFASGAIYMVLDQYKIDTYSNKPKRITMNTQVITLSNDDYSENGFIKRMHDANMMIYRCIGVKATVSVKESKFHSLRKEIETKVGYVGKRPHITKSKRIGLNKFQIEIDISTCPSLMSFTQQYLNNAAIIGLENVRKYWNTVISNCHAKLLAFDHVYEIETIVNEDAAVQRGKAYVAMTDAWRQAIGDGHRGQKYKTKALEGITWKYVQVGKKMVKQLIA